MIAVALPLPPSANRLWRVARSGKPYIAPAYAAWKREAGWMLAAAKVGAVQGPFDVEIGISARERGDADNRVKATLDLLRDMRVTDDDKHARKVTVERRDAVPTGTCIVTVRAAVSHETGKVAA